MVFGAGRGYQSEEQGLRGGDGEELQRRGKGKRIMRQER
jgi:hypothetical protein